MSGFEVAGIILGAYPLLMAALAVYSETKSGKGARRLVRTLKTEETIFNNFIHHILSPPTISEAEFVRLTDPARPDLDLWKDTTLETKLGRRLGGNTAEIVVQILREINDLLRSLRNELTSSDRGMNILRRFRSSLRNARHCLPHSSLQEHLIRLKEYNNNLERLLVDRSYISRVNYGGTSTSLKTYLRCDTSCAIDIYNAIYDGYRCSCDVAHLANFGLPQISESFGSDNDDTINEEQFELRFPIAMSELVGSFPTSTPVSETAADEVVGSLTRRISISEYNDHNGEEEHEPIQDLCDLLKRFDATAQVTNTRLGILQLKEKKYELKLPMYLQDMTSSGSIVCLDHHLAGQCFMLSRKERMNLALRMSYAVLQFYSTPWIEASWTWRDFFIDEQNGSQLFVTGKFYSSRSRDSTPTCTKSPMLSFLDIAEEPILIKLGFALIELAIGKRLADMRLEDQPQSLDSDMLDYSTAKELIASGRIMREESRGYEEVVKACLSHQFSCNSQLKSIDSSQPSFNKAVEQSIIEPLHKIWSIAWGNE